MRKYMENFIKTVMTIMVNIAHIMIKMELMLTHWAVHWNVFAMHTEWCPMQTWYDLACKIAKHVWRNGVGKLEKEITMCYNHFFEKRVPSFCTNISISSRIKLSSVNLKIHVESTINNNDPGNWLLWPTVLSNYKCTNLVILQLHMGRLGKYHI